jgi:hypothetical protein
MSKVIEGNNESRQTTAGIGLMRSVRCSCCHVGVVLGVGVRAMLLGQGVFFVNRGWMLGLYRIGRHRFSAGYIVGKQ